MVRTTYSMAMMFWIRLKANARPKMTSQNRGFCL
jgi:hypothetical protein